MRCPGGKVSRNAGARPRDSGPNTNTSPGRTSGKPSGSIRCSWAPADAHIHYLDGRELYGPQDNARYPLPDELHPEAEAHRLIGERFCARAFGAGAFGEGVA